MKKKTINKKSKQKIEKQDLNIIKEIITNLEEDPKAFEFKNPVDIVGLGLDDYLSVIKKPMDISTVKKNLSSAKYSNVKEVFDDIQLIWLNCKKYNLSGSEIWKMAKSLEKSTKNSFKKNFSELFEPKKPVKNSKKGSNPKCSNSENSSLDVIGNKNEEKEDLKKETVELKKDKDEASIDDMNKKENEDIKKEKSKKEQNEIQYPSLQEKKLINDTIRGLEMRELGIVVQFLSNECPKCIEDKDDKKIMIQVNKIDSATYDKLVKLFDKFNSKEKK